MKNSFQTKSELNVEGKTYHFHSLKKLQATTGKNLSRLPYSMKVLLENLIRHEDDLSVHKKDIEAVLNWDSKAVPSHEIQFMPARVVLQDFTGVPAVADLAAMRGAMKGWGGDPKKINPMQPVDLVVDHSVQVDTFGSSTALQTNSKLEFERNQERYEFLKWAQTAFTNFRVVPPATGIVHQVNLEYLSQVAFHKKEGDWVYPDTCLGTDSHTPMVNGLGIVAWGVGGIEAEAAMLGQPSCMLIPQVIGFKLNGKLPTGATATDLVLTVTQILRKKGVVGKFVEFFGPGMGELSIADRATIGNMAPEYGATIGIFPVDQKTLDYLELSGRGHLVPLVKAYYQEQGMWWDSQRPDPEFTEVLELNLADVKPSVAGPARPQDRSELGQARASFRQYLVSSYPKELESFPQSDLQGWANQQGWNGKGTAELLESHPDAKLGHLGHSVKVQDPTGAQYKLAHGSIVMAAITSCTNTSNPSVLLAAGLLARNAVKRGLSSRPWVKTSFAPGSKVVTEYMVDSGLMPYMEALKFHVVGYGCTTCIGNSGPLPEHVSKAITEGNLSTAAVLSGNRNFEARINPQIRGNYLMSPPLVVAYALAGNIQVDLTSEPLGIDPNGEPVYLKDIWPSQEEIAQYVGKHVTQKQFQKIYADVFAGSEEWKAIKAPSSDIYNWDAKSTYIKEPPFFSGLDKTPTQVTDIVAARALLWVGDSVTTDHISPAGNIKKDSPAGKYLSDLGVQAKDFNQYGARRGNHEVMMRGTFANVRIKNKLVEGKEGPITKHIPSGKELPIYDAAMEYQKSKTPVIVLAGKEYGSGSSRDWAAKGPQLQGVRAAIAESFERIHRSNLVGMGILPLQFKDGESAQKLGLTGEEEFTFEGLSKLTVGGDVTVKVKLPSGQSKTFTVLCRIDTPNELEYFKNGGILPYVLRQLAKKN